MPVSSLLPAKRMGLVSLVALLVRRGLAVSMHADLCPYSVEILICLFL